MDTRPQRMPTEETLPTKVPAYADRLVNESALPIPEDPPQKAPYIRATTFDRTVRHQWPDLALARVGVEVEGDESPDPPKTGSSGADAALANPDRGAHLFHERRSLAHVALRCKTVRINSQRGESGCASGMDGAAPYFTHASAARKRPASPPWRASAAGEMVALMRNIQRSAVVNHDAALPNTC